MSTRETVLAAIAAQLSGVAGGRVYRSRREQIDALPAVVIEPVSAEATEVVLGAVDHELTVAVAVLANGETPDGAADATLVDVHAALVADRSLGLGNGVTLLPGFSTDWDFEAFDFVRAENRYRVVYATTGTDF